ncbi:MAG TPA: endonuclease I [Flavobacteriales bacterium]|nr:endonuclease I [Flavobacteriales bacterium]|tara:strand:- start:6292 stop:7314 length:1023 start_codon:yes stop_codon:yes gene_type:complete
MRNIVVLLGLIVAVNCNAQIPTGYYDDAEGLTGEPLRDALEMIIDGHSSQSYGSLWTHMQSTDRKANGKVWDMYSTPEEGEQPAYEYTFVSDQCGNYSGEGSCYNREHSVPASWYNDASPTYTDLFHLYPTDGSTNGLRSNLPFGEVDNPSVTTSNGSKKGANTYPGYTGMVFEPIDEFKGDFARTYFYVVTRYMDNVASWNSSAFTGDNLSEWHANMLLEWHWNDPVSQKETERNNAVHDVQNNRNPYIDHPEWVDLIWASTSSVDEFGVNSLKLIVQDAHIEVEGNWETIELYSVDGRLLNASTKEENESIEVPTNQIVLIIVRSQNAVLTERYFLTK